MINNTAGDRTYAQISDRLHEAYAHIHKTGNWIDDKYTESAERKLRKITGRRHAKLVTCGTTAIQIALLAWNLKGKQIACSNYSYVASVNQAALLNKIDLYDVDTNGLLELSTRFDQDAVIPVSLYGNPIDYDHLKTSDKTKVLVDCAQGLGSSYKGRPDGSFGDVAIFSFARNKPIPTAGTHGALVWDDDDKSQKIKSISTNGKLGRSNPVDSYGVNGTPFELQAAWIDIGLDHMEEWQSKRKDIHNHYKQAFENLPVNIIEANENSDSNYHKFAMKSKDRDTLYKFLQDNKIKALLHYTDNFSDFFGSGAQFPNSQMLYQSIITLPNHAWMSDAEVETVSEKVQEFYK